MDPAQIPPPVNNFHDWPSFNYPTLYDQYCTNGSTIPGEKNVVAGIFYIVEYLFFLSLYVPSLIVVTQPRLFHHACYKLMFSIGIIENFVGFMFSFTAGVLSIMGANYCDNNWLLIVVGHITHISWGSYCMSVVILALNRCIEIHSVEMADRLFAGRKAFLWMIPPWIYALIFASTIDIPAIYNTVWSVYLFKIDFREGAPPVIDWICFWNCAWVICTLLVLYSLLLYRLKQNSKKYQANLAKTSKMHKHVMLQSFLICFFLFLVAILYAAAGFINLPNRLTKIATIAVQICSGFTSIVYLVINKEIRKGVKRMFFQNSTVNSISRSSLFKNEPAVKNPVSYKDRQLSDDHKYI